MKFYSNSTEKNKWEFVLNGKKTNLKEKVNKIDWLDENQGLGLAYYTRDSGYESIALFNEECQIIFTNIYSIEAYHPEINRIIISVQSNALDEEQLNKYHLKTDELYFGGIELTGEVANRFRLNNISVAELESDFQSNTSENDRKDIVSLYLQIKENLLLLPSSCTPRPEVVDFAMTRRESHERAIVVLNPRIPIQYIENSMGEIEELFLYNRPFDPDFAHFNVHYISEKQIWEFAKKHYGLLPETTKTWVGYFESLNH